MWPSLSQGQHEIIKVAAGRGQGQASPQELTDAQGLSAFSLAPKYTPLPLATVCLVCGDRRTWGHSSGSVLDFLLVVCLRRGSHWPTTY